MSDGVSIGEGSVVGPFAIILGPCSIGLDAWIGPHAVIGTPPEHKAHPRPAAWEGELGGAGVVIGDRVVVREHASIHQGTERPTTLGDDCFLMSRAHVGHDNHLMAGVTVAPGAAVAGHSTVGERANLGMGALVHQRVNIAPGAMLGMGAAVRRDVAAFTTVIGNPARVAGVNEVALRLLDVPDDVIARWSFLVSGEAEPAAWSAPLLEEVLARWQATLLDVREERR